MQNKIYQHYQKEINDKPSFLVGQKAFIVNNNGKVLILKRHDKSTQSNKWDFPGGRLNFYESLRRALRREIFEETGFEIDIVSIPLSICTFVRDIDKFTQITRIVYLCKVKGNMVISKEHKDYQWIEPSAYDSYDFIGEDYTKAFENYLKFKPETLEFLEEGILQDSLKFTKTKS